MKLWLDDVRPAPEGWRWAKTAGEALTLLLRGGVKVASLDTWLSTDVKYHPIFPTLAERAYRAPCLKVRTGLEVLQILEDAVLTRKLSARQLPKKVLVHDDHEAIAPRMRACWSKIEEMARTEAYLRRVCAERGLAPRWEHVRDPFALPHGAEVGYDAPVRREYMNRLNEAVRDALNVEQINPHRKDGRVGERRFERFTVCRLIRPSTALDSSGYDLVPPTEVATGYAFCSARDNFSRAEGRRLSLERALGL